MAGRSLLFGGCSNGSNMVPSYSGSPDQPLGSIFMAAPSSFLGSRSMLNFKDMNGANRSEKSFFRTFDQIENGDEDFEEYFQQPEKKRRLTVEQVQFLEKSFEEENKLEPERKVQLAKDLGLQPRQIAIWFQNRRARWKTRNLEKEYETLRASYESLKAEYDTLHNEKEKLRAEVLHLTDKLLLKDKGKEDSNLCDNNFFSEASLRKPIDDSVSANDISAMAFKQEALSSAKSDVFDSDSPHYTDGVHSSSFLEQRHSAYVFEPEQSDVSQDEDDYLNKNLFPPAYVFSEIENADHHPGPSTNSSDFGLNVEDHAFNFWSN